MSSWIGWGSSAPAQPQEQAQSQQMSDFEESKGADEGEITQEAPTTSGQDNG